MSNRKRKGNDDVKKGRRKPALEDMELDEDRVWELEPYWMLGWKECCIHYGIKSHVPPKNLRLIILKRKD